MSILGTMFGKQFEDVHKKNWKGSGMKKAVLTVDKSALHRYSVTDDKNMPQKGMIKANSEEIVVGIINTKEEDLPEIKLSDFTAKKAPDLKIVDFLKDHIGVDDKDWLETNLKQFDDVHFMLLMTPRNIRETEVGENAVSVGMLCLGQWVSVMFAGENAKDATLGLEEETYYLAVGWFKKKKKDDSVPDEEAEYWLNFNAASLLEIGK